MNGYYYITATLPYIKFGEKNAVSKNKFLEDCRKWLSEHDYEALQSATLCASGECSSNISFLKEWYVFNHEIREKIGQSRAKMKESGNTKRSDNVDEILQGKNPLETEMRFEEKRWNYLEEKAALYFFDINSLIAYFLKLQINERIEQFNKDAGEVFFNKLCEGKYEQANR